MKGGYLIRGFEGKMSYQGMCRKRLWKGVPLSIGAPMGNLAGPLTGNFKR